MFGSRKISVYRGMYTCGTPAYTVEGDRIYRGMFTCGTPTYTIEGNKIYDGINAKIRAKGSLIYSIFKKGIETKTYNMDRYGTFRHYLYDILFNSVCSLIVGELCRLRK